MESCPGARVSDEKLTLPEVCDLLGIKASTWRAYVARGQAPAAGGRHSERLPWWWRSTIEGWSVGRTSSTNATEPGHG